MTWNEQYVIDNTWKNEPEKTGYIDACPHCGYEDDHPITTGSNAFDQYMYCTCTKCGKRF